MSVYPPGQGPPGLPSRAALCPPGTAPVSVTVTDCATKANLGVIVPFTLSTADGQFATSANGVALVECAAEGYRFTVGLDNYVSQDHSITADEAKSGHVTLCLEKKPPAPPRPRYCIVHALTRTDEFEPSFRALAPYYRVRDVVASTSRGAKLVALYYDPDTKARTFDAIQTSLHLRSEGLALIVELEGLVARVIGPVASALYGQSSDCACADDATQRLLPADVMRRAARFLDMLEEESGAGELIDLARQLLETSEHGSRDVVRWLREDEE